MGTIDTKSVESYGERSSAFTLAANFVLKALGAVDVFGRKFDDALAKRRSRMDLMRLSDHDLKDIGISRYDAFREANRPFWD